MAVRETSGEQVHIMNNISVKFEDSPNGLPKARVNKAIQRRLLLQYFWRYVCHKLGWTYVRMAGHMDKGNLYAPHMEA